MKKTLISMIAVAFAFVLGTAQAAKHEGPAPAPAVTKEVKKPAKESPLAKACKGKKVGEVVNVDGKDVKCPAKKTSKKKMEKKGDDKKADEAKK
ncbi:MAG: hypothetical protein AABZ50_06890 [Pseudomonadota bacterium]